MCKIFLLWGLGIKDVGLFNSAPIKKWIWRFVNESNRLWTRVMRSKHRGFFRESGDVKGVNRGRRSRGEPGGGGGRGVRY